MQKTARAVASLVGIKKGRAEMVNEPRWTCSKLYDT